MSISDWGIQAIPVITIIVFLIAEAVKATPLDNKWLPGISRLTASLSGRMTWLRSKTSPADRRGGQHEHF